MSVPVPGAAIGLGENVARPPVGSPEALIVTGAAKPLSAPTLTANDADSPGRTDAAPGMADTVKSGGPLTSSVTAAVRDRRPLVALIRRGYEPGASEPAVGTESVELPLPPPTVAGANVAVP